MTTPTSTKAEIDQALPELPEPKRFFGHSTMMPMWCTEEMRAYATEAIAAERAEVERLRAVCEKLRKALRPFAAYACSPVGTCNCNNCVARAALATPTQGGAL